MGCKNSREVSETDAIGAHHRKSLVPKESYKKLTEEDIYRIQQVLAYWFDENYARDTASSTASTFGATI